MMLKELDAWAEEAELRYGDLETALQGLYNSMVSDVAAGTPAVTSMNRVYKIVQRYQAREHEEIERRFAELAQSVQGTLLAKIAVSAHDDYADAISEHLQAAVDHLLGEIFAQIERDMINMRRSLSLALLEITAIARARRLPQHVALVHYKLARNDELKLQFRDRAGRVTAAGKFIRASWRHALVMLRNEVTLILLAAHGYNRAAVLKETDGQITHQLEITIAGEPNIAAYREVLASHFHPNSTCWLDLNHV